MGNADDKTKGDAPSRPHEHEDTPRRNGESDKERGRPKQEDELEEGLDDTFPASDPPAPSRPTGET